MNKYELLYIVEAGISDEEKEKVVQTVTAVVEAAGGTVVGEIDKWGVRKYAYTIDYKTEGYYVLMNFEAADSAPAAITAKLNINKNVVRHMIVAK